MNVAQAQDFLTEIIDRVQSGHELNSFLVESKTQKAEIDFNPQNSHETYVARNGAKYHLLGRFHWAYMGFDSKGIADNVRKFLTQLFPLSEDQPDLFLFCEFCHTPPADAVFWLAHRVREKKNAPENWTLNYTNYVVTKHDTMGIPKGTVLIPVPCPEGQSPELAAHVWVSYENNALHGAKPVILHRSEYAFVKL
jgi:hypothetical protein